MSNVRVNVTQINQVVKLTDGLYLKDMISQNIDQLIIIKLINGQQLKGVITASFSDCLILITGKSDRAVYVRYPAIAYIYRVKQ